MKKFPDWFFNQSDWQEKTLGEVCEFSRGGNISKKNLSEKGTPCILYGELYTFYKEIADKIKSFTDVEEKKLTLGKSGDILMPLSGETAEDISVATCVLNDKVAYGGDLLILRTSAENDGRFISYLINSTLKLKIAKIAQGKSIVHINADNLKILKIKIPCLEEQKKIAEYFTHLDNAINAQETKLKSWREVKKAMLQKIFAQEYFFTQDNGDKFPAWQEKTLGEVAEITSSKRIFVSEYVSEGVPFIRGQEISDNSISSSEKFNCYISEERYNEIKNQSGVPQKNDILITAVGTIGNLYLVEEDKKFYFKDGNIIWIKNFNQSIAANYLKIFMQSYNFKNQILNFAMGGAQKALTIEKLFNAKIKIPCLEEQKKIAEYFSSLDRIIDAENKMLENLRLMKKGLLQKLFV